MTWSEEKRKSDNLKFMVNDILENQWCQSGYDEEEALKCIVKFATQRLEDLKNL